jgi:type II secretory pathway component PulJ
MATAVLVAIGVLAILGVILFRFVLAEVTHGYEIQASVIELIEDLQRRVGEAEQIIADRIGDL